METSYRLLAARYVRKQTKQLLSQLDGIRVGEDIEYVHRARVATRRLRAALELFADCFAAGPLAKWNSEIRRLTRGLGSARDRDVQIEFLLDALRNVGKPEQYCGIARLLDGLLRDREKLQPKVVKRLDRFVVSGVGPQMLRAAKALLAKKHKTDAVAARQRAGPPLVEAVERLLAFDGCLDCADGREEHHQMRIAAKQLRYTLEILGPAYEDRLADAVRQIKGLQTLLGDLHDCDVWVDDLHAFREKQRDRTHKYFGSDAPFARIDVGITHLVATRRRQRERLLAESQAYWTSMRSRRALDRLLLAVGGRPTRPLAASDPDRPGWPGPRPDGPREEPASVKPSGDRVVSPNMAPTQISQTVSHTAKPSACAPSFSLNGKSDG